MYNNVLVQLFKKIGAIILLTSPGWSTPIPRPQQLLYPKISSNDLAPSLDKTEGDLEPQGTIGLNVFASPLGGVYSGIGAVNPYSYGLGSIGTAYGVNQLNSAGYGGLGMNGLNGLGAGFGAGMGALGPASFGGMGLGGFGGGIGGFGGGYPANLFGGSGLYT